LQVFAGDQLAWILGRNPYDVCMLQGRGRNNPEYHSDFPNVPGGIVNGITSGWTDEHDLAFLPADAAVGEEWRWAEQRIPHTAWHLLATVSVTHPKHLVAHRKIHRMSGLWITESLENKGVLALKTVGGGV
jgi:hypothetical protein